MYKRAASFAIFMTLFVASCSTNFTANATPIPSPTSTPKPLKLFNGELDPCLLITSTEAEVALSIKDISESRFLSSEGIYFCKYEIPDERVVFVTSVVTDASLKKANSYFSTAVEFYEKDKESKLITSGIIKIENLENLGDQANVQRGTFLAIKLLNNDIYYDFYTQTESGINYDRLLELVKIALQRMPLNQINEEII